MVFSSSVFLFAFVPAFFAVYFIVPRRAAKNTWLFLASLFFYAWGEPVYVVLMLVSIIANWVFGLAIDNTSSKKMVDAKRRVLLIVSIVFNVAVIGFFKYEGFLAANVNALVGIQAIPDLKLPLPIGISFYTLQALSYVVDVYRGEISSQRKPLYLGMYIACFPQLIAGPIVRYSTIQKQVVGRKETLTQFASGMRLFTVGLAKKVLLANTVAILADNALSLGGSQIGAIGAWTGVFGHIYTIAVFVFGWSFFWITDTGALIEFWKAMTGRYGATGTSTLWELTSWEYWPVFVVCTLASTPVCPWIKERITAWVEKRAPKKICEDGSANPRTITSIGLCDLEAEPATPDRARVLAFIQTAYDIVLLAILLLCCISIVSGSFNPFIYFQF